ncbi:MAG: uroporphyrinogen-III synthase [Micavibrio aeruginosavorus]|nr:uroporphyrinogen-III synthase [Micavibrio aeruginosavorus]
MDPLCVPVLEIRETGAALPDPALYKAIIFSSAAGARAFAARGADPRWLSKKVFAVGEHTAALARQAGWGDVVSAAGTMVDLVALMRKTLAPPARLAHFRGRDVRHDPAEDLEPDGYRVDGIILYEANPVPTLPPHIVAALQNSGIDAVMFYSARSASAFAAALRRDWPEADLRGTKALCLAHSVVESAMGLNWAEILVSPTPDQAGMQSLLKQIVRDASRSEPA